jgi:DNA-binding NtrC family response regulator
MADLHATPTLPFTMVKALYDIRKKIDDLYQLDEISDSSDVVTLMERILHVAANELNVGEIPKVERGLILLPSGDRAQESYETVAVYKMTDTDVEFSRTIVRQAIQSGEAVVCSNALDDPRFRNAESIRNLKVLGCICVPIKIGPRNIGALYVDNRTVAGVLTDEDRLFLQELALAVARPIDTAQFHLGKVETLQKQLEDRYGLEGIVGESPPMQQVYKLIRVASKVNSTVLITGETGTGKELVAQAIHYLSDRKRMPFIAVDCSAIPESLLESELFGHRKKAFTDARDRKGAFEEAHRGTLFLDEVADASPALQRKLRRALQEGEVKRLGENVPRKVDVRIICATNQNLSQKVQEGEFREDLFYRINVISIHLPSLRQRAVDIPLLLEYFLRDLTRERRQRPSFTREAAEALRHYQWPGNIRELRNVVEQSIVLCSSDRIDLADLPPSIRGESVLPPLPPDVVSTVRPLKEALGDAERKILLSVLTRTGWNRKQAAEILGISRVTLYKKMVKFDLTAPLVQE